jgi:cellulose synthase operon protein C
MMRARTVALLVACTATAALTPGAADAQPGRRSPTTDEPELEREAPQPTNLRSRLGTEYASRLLQSTDADERIRGIDRAAALGTPEAVTLLAQAASGSSAMRADSRALVALARALAPFAQQERVRAALLGMVNMGGPGTAGRMPQSGRGPNALLLEEGDPVARTELARETAAIALARSGSDRALEQLYGAARGGGSGQRAALLALAVQPPRDPGFFGTAGASLPPPVIRMLGQLGDLRALEVLTAATRGADVATRAAALVALAELGDGRAIPVARSAIVERDVRLRRAAGEALIILGAPERFKAVAALIADDATAPIGLHLAERVHDPEITRLVAARATGHPQREVRSAALRTLGLSPQPSAADALASPQLAGDAALGYDAVLALSRSPAPNARELLARLVRGPQRALGVRGYVVRALLRGEHHDDAERAIAEMARSGDPAGRALGVFARVALGREPLDRYLDHGDVRVRRAAAMASLARPSTKVRRALVDRMAKERDPVLRHVLGIGLLEGDPGGAVPTNRLLGRIDEGGPDAPLAAFALAARADENLSRRIDALLSSRDPMVRTHTARGLGRAKLADASGRLAEAYAYEVDVDARRAIVAALASRTGDASAPARARTLALASRLDPDGPTRQLARLALGGSAAPLAAPLTFEVAWLRLTREGGAQPTEAFAGALVGSDGVALPIAFDEEGYAIVARVPPGEARLVLAPRLPSYEASSP